MMKAWHFVGGTLRDGRPVPVDGEWLVHDGPVVICESGLHASVDVWDALRYAPGPVLCRVDVGGVVLEGIDKIVASRRRIVERVDLANDLRRFACDEALRAAHLWDMPDVVRDYLTTRDDSLREAAAEAARSAWAFSAADATADAAKAAGRAAAWAADAARSAAAWGAECRRSGVARDAAYAASWAAWAAGEQDRLAVDKAAERFRAMVHEKFAR
jgi:hypothetical protein